ncbi:phosphate transport system permease protein [Caulobacter ginsengisoli]|uniref:Phosphate transport system permease protein n=1 Tax=Caulobacter ginsengisoli TaxID=400775 RepID=A0ABU0IWV3_9CAUL|nr:phosphate ABC transporter permease subunit PstC [Caulobacter ginsengisoli]MDQ0466496.1 phosphate transport system permease protein [Caulobacter ginsengisoli]
MIFLIALAALLALSASAYQLARRRAVSSAGGRLAILHSLPGYHGTWVALWTGAPAALLLVLFLIFGARLEGAAIQAQTPPAVAKLDAQRQAVFYSDVQATAAGKARSAVSWDGELKTAFEAKTAEARNISTLGLVLAIGLAVVLALAGFLLAYPRLNKDFRARNRVEGWTDLLLVVCSAVAVLTTVAIVASVAWESFRFFQSVSPLDFWFGTDWSPQIAMREDQVAAKGAFGAVPLFAGTFLIMAIAMILAGPVGLFSAIYLSEYAGSAVRAWVKPLLEILAGVPTVVYGFFAALTVGPIFRSFFNWIGSFLVGGPLDGLGQYLAGVQNQMALTAGVVMGIMLIPFVSSLSDDIINAVPQSLRDGSLAMGATKSETITQVILPAALPGVVGAMMLAMSRAIGETMIVAMAAGLQAKLTANPLDTVTTVTVQIVTLLTGDQEFDSPKTLAAFGLGLTLFVVTLTLNIIALTIVRKYREQYD